MVLVVPVHELSTLLREDEGRGRAGQLPDQAHLLGLWREAVQAVGGQVDRGGETVVIGSVTGWVRWHLLELTTAVLPAVAAVTVHPAWGAVTGAVIGRWVWQEYTAPRHEPGPPPEQPRRDHERQEESA